MGSGAGPGSGAVQSVILPPQVLKRYEPEYPMSARRANQEGVVGLRIEILANGLPGDISVARSSGYETLDSAAEVSVRNWRFVPARDSQSGAPVASVTVLSVAFRLR
jgi:protein TonB